MKVLFAFMKFMKSKQLRFKTKFKPLKEAVTSISISPDDSKIALGTLSLLAIQAIMEQLK